MSLIKALGPGRMFTIVIVILLFLIPTFGINGDREDIKNYIEDSGKDYDWLEFYMLIFFLIFYYILPIPFEHIVPKKYIPHPLRHSVLGTFFSIIFIIFILYIVFPLLTTAEGPERDYIFKIIYSWLGWLFALNILVADREVSVWLEERLFGSTQCRKTQECASECLSN
jgi:hypothetical protein